MKTKNSWQLRAFCAAAKPLLFLLLATSCSPSDDFSTTCPSGDCEAVMVFPVQPDEDGYFHIGLDWSGEYYPYFTIELLAETVDSIYFYNNSPVVQAYFDSNLIWTVGDSLVMPDNLYNPFSSNVTSSGTTLPVSDIDIIVKPPGGTTVNIAAGPNIRSYFKSISNGNMLYSRKVLGPFPPESIGDTVTLYMEVFWDAGAESIIKNHYKQKFIVE